MINITENDYNIVRQRIHNRFIKLNILDYQFRTVDEISGNMLDCSVNMDADSDLRRSCSVSLVVYGANAAKFETAAGSEIFLDKYVQPFVGEENLYTGEIQWYNQGIYLINAPTYRFDAATHTLNFEGLDLMSKLTGVRNGQLSGIPTVIKAGENVRQAMISTLALGGFDQYVIDECRLDDGAIQNVPVDINIAQGGTVFDVLSALCNILPKYQIYFDEDGVFHYNKTPTGDNEPIIMDDTLLNHVLISEDISTDFASVKNYIEIYGRAHDVQHYASEIVVTGSALTLTIASLTALADSIIIGFTPPVAVSGAVTINASELGAKALVDSSGNAVAALDANVYYVAQYQQASDNWMFLGHQQAQAVYSDTNPLSPFYINGPVGIIRDVLTGGEYDNIQSDELALERAKYELYLKARLNDNITLSCIPIPWIDVNVLIQHSERGVGEPQTYMIKSVNFDFSESGTMSITAVTYYPAVPMI